MAILVKSMKSNGINITIISFLFLLVSLSVFSACQLFENDVADFMEKYTETAAIETHTINANTYEDALEQLCIASEEDASITYYMRNPKQFMMRPSADFTSLKGNVSRSAINIEQINTEMVQLDMPQSFLIAADEGQNITAEISLYEPMSGREFDIYQVPLFCNSVPPQILNPTVMNNDGKTFLIAFDMPNEENVAIRHKDISEIVINGSSYPVEITLEEDSEGIKHAVYNFKDSRFSRVMSPSYIAINQKSFEHNRNSVYFNTGDTFSAADKEYTLVLKDRAGLESSVKASTSISKLEKPQILDQNEAHISEGGITGIPFNEETKIGKITIIPPTKDHLGNSVSGTTVHYKVYEATGSGLIYTSGTTTSARTIELPQNTYRVEAYATLTNYENSATATVKFRFINNVLFVAASSSYDGGERDGSENAPFRTIAEALEDIEARQRKDAKFTLYVAGDFTGTTYDSTGASSTTNGQILLNDSEVNTGELIITQNPKSNAAAAVLSSVTLDSALDSSLKVTLSNIKISGSGTGISQTSQVDLTLDGIEVTGFTGTFDSAIKVTRGNTTIKNVNIHDNQVGIDAILTAATDKVTVESGTIRANRYGFSSSSHNGSCTISGGTFTQNTINAVYLYDGDCTITGGNITANSGRGITLGTNSTLKLYGASITQNTNGGINVGSSCNLHVMNKPYVMNNTEGTPAAASNISLASGTIITIDGSLTSGARMGITTDSGDEPADIGDTYSFANGYRNSGSPAQFFTSDKGFSIVKGSGNAVNIANAGSSGGIGGNAYDYAMSFAFEKEDGTAITSFNQDEVTPLYIKPAITKNGSPVTYSSLKSSISWTIKFYNGGTFVQNLSVAENGSQRIKVNLPSSLVGSYIVEVSANLLSLSHPGSCSLQCVDPNAPVVYPSVSSLSTAPTSGTYSLNSLDELKQIRTWVNTAPRSTFDNVTFILTGDIDTQGEEIIIGYYQTSSFGSPTEFAFKGTFDGNGHKITNTINATNSNYSHSALFYLVKGGTIKNLTVAGTSNCNSIVGYLYGGTIENCVSETDITIDSSSTWSAGNSETYVGGIVSYAGMKNGIDSVIKNCVNKGNITIDNGSSIRAGGITGTFWSNGGAGEIDRCINNGNITVNASIRGVGGIVGQLGHYKYVRNCKNLGSLSIITDTNANCVGGIAGELNNGEDASETSRMILNCCNLGTINPSRNYGSGLFGDIPKKPNLKNNCTSGYSYYGFGASMNTLTGCDWIENNYCMSVSYRSNEIVNYTGSVVIDASNITSFTTANASSTVTSLNNWITTNRTSEGDYAGWILNAQGKPELDLGELDNQ